MYQGEYTMPPLHPNQPSSRNTWTVRSHYSYQYLYVSEYLTSKYFCSKVWIASRYLEQSNYLQSNYGYLGSGSTYLGGAGSANTSRGKRQQIGWYFGFPQVFFQAKSTMRSKQEIRYAKKVSGMKFRSLLGVDG